MPSHLWQESIIRLYENEPIRACVRVFFPAKQPNKWLFPVGCYNSGTTVTQKLMAAHPEISTLPKEGVRFTSELPAPEDKGWTRMWIRCHEYMEIGSAYEPERAHRIIKDWSPWLDSTCPVFMDKSISNVARITWLDKNFSNAYFIGIVRDGYCVAEGLRRRAIPRGDAAKEIGLKYPIEMAGEQWVAANERLLSAASTVQNFLLVKYEDIVDDPKYLLSQIWEFIGLQPPRLEPITDGLIIGEQKYRIEKNNNTESHQRLSNDDIFRLTPIIRDMQQKLGYPLLLQE